MTTSFTDITTTTWDDALSAIEKGYELGWSDGLPVVPPTTARVAEFIGYAGREPDEVVGELPERRRVITVEKAAANSVMAGCLPGVFSGRPGRHRGHAGSGVQPGGAVLQHGRRGDIVRR